MPRHDSTQLIKRNTRQSASQAPLIHLCLNDNGDKCFTFTYVLTYF